MKFLTMKEKISINQINDLDKMIKDQSIEISTNTKEIDDLKKVIKIQEELIKSNQEASKNFISSLIESLNQKYSELQLMVNKIISKYDETIKLQSERISTLENELSNSIERNIQFCLKNENKVNFEIKMQNEKINSINKDLTKLANYLQFVNDKKNEEKKYIFNNDSCFTPNNTYKFNQVNSTAKKKTGQAE